MASAWLRTLRRESAAASMPERSGLSRVDPDMIARAEAMLIGSPVARHLGIRLVAMAQDTALLKLPFAPSNVTVGNIVHGGVIATLADIAGVCAAVTGADAATLAGGATSSMAISYLRAADGIDLEASAQVLHASKRQTVCQVTIRDAEAVLVAQALVTVALFSSSRGA